MVNETKPFEIEEVKPGTTLECGHEDTLAHLLVGSILVEYATYRLIGYPPEIVKGHLVKGVTRVFEGLGINNYRMPKGETAQKEEADGFLVPGNKEIH